MATREEVGHEISSILAEGRKIIIPEGATGRARREHERATRRFEETGRDLLKMEMPQYFRFGMFGSSRIPRGSEDYKHARNLAFAVVEECDADIVTGAGPGIMEAADLGLRIAIRKASILGEKKKTATNHGVIWQLSHEKPNEKIRFTSKHRLISTRANRLVSMSNHVHLHVGGIGSVYEGMNVVQLMQMRHVEDDYGMTADPFWERHFSGMRDLFYTDRVANGEVPLMGEHDFDRIIFTRDIPEIVDIIKKNQTKWKQEIADKVRVYPEE